MSEFFCITDGRPWYKQIIGGILLIPILCIWAIGVLCLFAIFVLLCDILHVSFAAGAIVVVKGLACGVIAVFYVVAFEWARRRE